MIKIPSDTKKYAITPTSDLFGNIWFTKNCNFDEDGYLKLAARSVLLKSSESDASFGLVSSIGRSGEGELLLDSIINQYTAEITPISVVVAPDAYTSVPTAVGDGSRGCWFNKNWHVSTDTKMFYRPASGSAWTDSGISLTSGNVHPIEVFKNRTTICVGDGSKVRQYSNTYVTTQDLNIPTDYQVVKMSYSNNRLGIVTRLATASSAENIDAFFFVWDGITAVANSGIPVASDQVLDIVAYKSSWVILTRNGQLLYFNGAGWTTLGTLPFYFLNKIWGSFTTTLGYGDIMQVSGDLIFINVPSSLNPFGQKGERYIQNFSSGVWCYDPSVGLYHRYSPSFSPIYLLKVQAGGTNTGTGIMTVSGGTTIPDTGNPIEYVHTVVDLIGGLTKTTIYYIIKLSATTFQVATTQANALAGIFVPLTSAASNDSFFYALEVLDFGGSKAGQTANSVGGVALMGLKNKLYENIVFASTNQHETLSAQETDLCLTVPFFENRGYVVTAKATSNDIQDIYDKVFLKFKPLKVTDTMIVKAKTKDYFGLPTTLSQTEVFNSEATWVDNLSFTTSADLSEALAYMTTYHKELECEIINGAGAGQLEQIATIVLNSGIYTVTLNKAVIGVVTGNKSEVVIDNWQVLNTVDYQNTDNYVELPFGEPSKWAMVKVEMRGSDIKIEELQIVNATQQSPQ